MTRLWVVEVNRFEKKTFLTSEMSSTLRGILCAPARSQIIEDYASMQTGYGSIYKK